MDLKQLATTLRILSADMVERAQSGHPGASLGMADIASVLWTKFLRFDASNPDWPNRDRVIFFQRSCFIFGICDFVYDGGKRCRVGRFKKIPLL